MSKIRLFAAVVFGLGLLLVPGWAFLTWRQGPFTLLLDTGDVCFSPAAAGYAVTVDPGCYSSTCTLAARQSGEVALDESTATINVSASFLLRRLDFPRGSRECATDCDGPPALQLRLAELPPRDHYTVRFGGRWVGELALPVTAQVCFDDRPPFPTPMGGAAPAVPGAIEPSPAASGPTAGAPLAYPGPDIPASAGTPTAGAPYP